MKKRLLFIAFSIILILSISINVLLATSNNNAKKYILSGIYTHLMNISKLLDSMELSISNDSEIENYTLLTLERECIQLDDSIYALDSLSPNIKTSKQFKDLYRNISGIITQNPNTPEQVISDISEYKEKIQELIAKLSPKGKLSTNEYNDIYLNPNNSLSIKQIINFIGDTLTNF